MATEVGWARSMTVVMVINDDGDTTCAEIFPQIAPRLVDPNNKSENYYILSIITILQSLNCREYFDVLALDVLSNARAINTKMKHSHV
jgi:hypothetical protein